MIVSEMEKDSLISHGATSTIMERLCTSSDLYRGVYCKSCGLMAKVETSIIRTGAGSKMKPTFMCPRCPGDEGSQCVKVNVPYSYLLLYNYLAATGIHLKLSFTKRQKKEIIDNEPSAEEEEEEETPEEEEEEISEEEYSSEDIDE